MVCGISQVTDERTRMMGSPRLVSHLRNVWLSVVTPVCSRSS